MYVEEFNKIVEERFDKIRETLIEKAKEYTVEGGDRFHSFNSAALMNEESVERALWGMLSKHVISVRDICFENTPVTEKLIEEKVGDWIIYGFLLEGILKEKLKNEEIAKEG